MTDRASLFIPAEYVERRTNRACLWKASGAVEEPWEGLLDDSIVALERCLGFEISCRLHVVVYSTNVEARACLDRDVPPTMLLVPVSGANDSVIAVQSTAADAANGDCRRMRRLLCHELAHVMVTLRSGSAKRLGDGNRNMRVASWVNEGFAVCVAAIATDQLDDIERKLARARGCSLVVHLDSALDDLNGEHRSEAFAVATARVWKAIQARGLRQVFATLTEPDRLLEG